MGHAYTPSKTLKYEARVREAWGNREPFQGMVEVDIYEMIEIPQSWTHKKKDEAVARKANRKPDVDNCAKIVMDALNRVAYRDDVDVVRLTVTKVWSASPFVTVKIREVEE